MKLFSGITQSVSEKRTRLYLALFLAIALPQVALSADGIKNNTATMNLASDWSNGALGISDIGTFDATISTANAAALQLGGSISIGELSFGTINGPVTIGNTGGYTLTLNGVAGTGIDMSAASQNVTINSIVDLAASQTWNVGTSRTLSIAGEITGSGALTKSGGGILSLSKAMTSTGGVIVNAGQLKLDVGDSIGYAITINAGGTIYLNGNNQIANTVTSFTINGGTFYLGTKSETIETAITLTSGAISGSANTGSLMANGGYIGTGNNTITKIIGVAGGDSGLFNIISGTTTDSGSIIGAGGVTKIGNGTLILSGISTYTGTTAVSAGTLQFKKATALPGYNSGTATTVSGTGVLAVNAGSVSGEWSSLEIDRLRANGSVTFASGTALGIDTTGGNFTYASNIAAKGGMGFVKLGVNTLTLSGANTYTGATTVRAGTLLINNTSGVGIGAGGVTVDIGATLGGSGTISGAAIINGTLAPGNSIGTIHFTSDLTLTGTFAIELNGTGAGSTDVIAMNGNVLDITAGMVDFTTLGTLDADAYVFVTDYGTLTGTFAESNTPEGYQINYNYLGNNIALEMVPEPSTSILVGVGILGMLMIRRMKQKRQK